MKFCGLNLKSQGVEGLGTSFAYLSFICIFSLNDNNNRKNKKKSNKQAKIKVMTSNDFAKYDYLVIAVAIKTERNLNPE